MMTKAVQHPGGKLHNQTMLQQARSDKKARSKLTNAHRKAGECCTYRCTNSAKSKRRPTGPQRAGSGTLSNASAELKKRR